MGLLRFVIDNARDARALGLSFALRRLRQRPRRPWVDVNLKGVGPVALRIRSTDADVFSQVFTKGEYDLRRFAQYAGINARYREIVEMGAKPLIVDAGANNGASALWFASQFPAAKVIAVEPHPDNVRVCRHNTSRFDIDVVPSAIGSEHGFVDLITENRELWAVSTTRQDHVNETGAVSVRTIADIVASHSPLGRLFIVKIDIEGFESDLFASNTDWVADAEVIIIEPHDWMLPGIRSSQTFQRVLGQHDFDVLISGENLVYVRRAEPSGPVQCGHDRS